MCNSLGPGIPRRSVSVSTSLATLCPSIGPKYRSFNDSNRLALLLTIPFNPSASLCPIARLKFLPTGNLPSNFQTSSFTLLYVGEVVISVKYSFKAPTLGSMPILLSLRIMSMSVSATPAWFIPSKARPAVIAPSPITAIHFRSVSPLYFAAIAIPNAAEIEVEE